MIRIEDLHKNFGPLEVLKGIDLHIRPGEVVVIIGPSGSGKSTLLRCINLLEDISSGTVIVDGLDLKDKDTDINFIRTEVGMVFQQFNLFPHMTAMENVTLGPIKVRKMSKKKAQNLGLELLRKVGLEDKAHVYPRPTERRSKTACRHRPVSGAHTQSHAVRRTHQRFGSGTGR